MVENTNGSAVNGGKISVNRRKFIAGAGAAALSFTVIKPELVRGAAANSKIKLGLVGCGGRGNWIANLFKKNGNYEIVAAADFFHDRVDSFGENEEHKVPKANRYTGLSCHQKLLAQGVDAIAIITPPYFHPEEAADAVDAGVHVYLAKPIAVDVPGCHSIAASGKKATQKKLCFLVDFQTRSNAFYVEAIRRVHNGDIGEIHTIHATAKGWLLQYGTHLVDYMMFLNGGHRGKWVVGHVQGKEKLVDSHPSPDYAMGQFEFENGVRGILECGSLAPDQPGNNSFWMNAGATVYGSEGYAQAIVGSGWQAVTRSSSGLIEGSGGFDVEKDQAPYIRDLADWLDDPARIHPCNGDVTYHGFELVMGVCLSSLERRKITVPLESREPIMERLKSVL